MILASGPTTMDRMRSGFRRRATRPASLLTTGPIAAAIRSRAFAVAAGKRASGEYVPRRGEKAPKYRSNRVSPRSNCGSRAASASGLNRATVRRSPSPSTPICFAR
jgi:hypothetical protein